MADWSWISLMSLQQRTQLGDRSGIDDVGRRQPAPPGLIDTKSHALEGTDGVGVGRDGDPDPGLACGVRLHVVDVEPVWLGIQLQMAALLSCRGDDALH